MDTSSIFVTFRTKNINKLIRITYVGNLNYDSIYSAVETNFNITNPVFSINNSQVANNDLGDIIMQYKENPNFIIDLKS